MNTKALKSLLALTIAANPMLAILAEEYSTYAYTYEEPTYETYIYEYEKEYPEEVYYEETYSYYPEYAYDYPEYDSYEPETVYEELPSELVLQFQELLAEHEIAGILNPMGEQSEIPLLETGIYLPASEPAVLLGIYQSGDQLYFQIQTYAHTGYIHAGNFATSDPNFHEWRASFHIDPFGRILSPRARSAQQNATNLNAFPASYRPLIQALMNQRPNWTFVPFNTGRDWNTEVAVQMECPGVTRNCRSLVPWNSPASWIDNDRRVEPNWVQASESALRYFMDPRNFINDQDIFQFEMLSFNQNAHTLPAIENVLRGTFMENNRRLANNQTYAQVFLALGREFNVSPLHLAGRVRHEQGVQGTSGLISGTVAGFEGLFNYFNFGATAGGGATNAQIVAAGLTLARNEGWTTRDAALRGGAQRLGGTWVQRGQNTLYLQKFDVRPNRPGWPQNFMQNITAPRGEARNVRNSYANMGILNSHFVFSIPVFSGMPNQASPEPGTFNWDGLDWSPVFDPAFYINRYSDLSHMSYQQAFTHFINNGMREGRQAHANFNVHTYRNRYQDLRRAFRVDLPRFYRHFLTNGYREGRSATGTATLVPITSLNNINYSSVFDANFYLNRYPDLRRVFVQRIRGVDVIDDVGLLNHFINHGMREGRQAHANFNVTAYRNRYGDLQRAFGTDLPRFYLHFINHGQREGRVAISMMWNGQDMSPVFNPVFYLNRYPDLRRQNWTHAQAFNHFISHGMREGRQAHANFSVTAYRNRYGDLQRAFGEDLPRFYLHFIRWGIAEGRNARP